MKIEIGLFNFTVNSIEFKRPGNVTDVDLLSLCNPGNICPSCCQAASIQFKKRMTGNMMRGLIHLYRADKVNQKQAEPLEWLFIDEVVKNLDKNTGARVRGDISKLKHWGLIEKPNIDRYDGMPTRVGRNGLYKITRMGRLFAEGNVSMPEFAAVYNDETLGTHGEVLYIHEAKVQNFDWDEEFNGIPGEVDN